MKENKEEKIKLCKVVFLDDIVPERAELTFEKYIVAKKEKKSCIDIFTKKRYPFYNAHKDQNNNVKYGIDESDKGNDIALKDADLTEYFKDNYKKYKKESLLQKMKDTFTKEEGKVKELVHKIIK